MVSAFFKNIAQKMTLIELLRIAPPSRTGRLEMKDKFAGY